VLLPVAAAASAATILAVLGLWHLTNEADELSIEKQRQAAVFTMNSAIDGLAENQEIAAVWDSAVAELTKPKPDWQWVDDNIGSWLFNMFKHEQIYILDAHDRPIYATIAGARVEPEHYAALAPALSVFVDEVRGRTSHHSGTHDRLPNRPLHLQSTVTTKDVAVHSTDLTWLRGRPAAVSIMRIMPHTQVNPILALSHCSSAFGPLTEI
jgi:sensor domain CHASE-containing protein